MEKNFKITFIGAGSIGFTRGLLTDILSVPELQHIRIAFMSINFAREILKPTGWIFRFWRRRIAGKR